MIWLIGFGVGAAVFLVGLFLHEYCDFRLYFLIVNGPHKVVVLDYDPDAAE